MSLLTALVAASTLDAMAATYYADRDGDGFGYGPGVDSDSPIPGWVTNDGDCLPHRPLGNPAANELCNGVDDDCDGLIDDDDPDVGPSTLRWFYLDLDGDRYGDDTVAVKACEEPVGYVGKDGDCADDDATVHADAPEYCDGKDNDCDGATDDSVVYFDVYRDADGDGFGAHRDVLSVCVDLDGYVRIARDCDDDDIGIGPRADDVCGNGIDEDCDGVADNCRIDEHDFVLRADEAHYYLGWMITTPDLNGDGVSDLVATDAGPTRDGAYGVFGPTSGRTQAADSDVAIVSDLDRECYRTWEMSSGDANGDGWDDLLVGSPCIDTSYLLLGPVTADRHTGDADAVLVSFDRYEDSQLTTAISPDTTGDGTPDVLIAAPYGALFAGEVDVASGDSFGSVDLRAEATYRYVGRNRFDFLGREACHDAGDTDGDGIADLAIGEAGSNNGVVYIVRGGSAPGTYPVGAATDAMVRGNFEISHYFASAVTAADYDGDGASDLIVGGRYAQPDEGSVYVFLGPIVHDLESVDADAIWYGRGDPSPYVDAVAVGGDVDDDGSADMIVGRHTRDGGAVFVEFGWAPGSHVLNDLQSIRGHGAGLVGTSVAFLSDWSGDGGDEIATGAPSAQTDGEGAVYVTFSDQLF